MVSKTAENKIIEGIFHSTAKLIFKETNKTMQKLMFIIFIENIKRGKNIQDNSNNNATACLAMMVY